MLSYQEEMNRLGYDEFSRRYPETVAFIRAAPQGDISYWGGEEAVDYYFQGEIQKQAQAQQAAQQAAAAEAARIEAKQAAAVKLAEDIKATDAKARGRYQSRNDIRESGLDPVAVRHQQIAVADHNKNALTYNADVATLNDDITTFNNGQKAQADASLADYNNTIQRWEADKTNSGLLKGLDRDKVEGLVNSANATSASLQSRADALGTRKADLGLINQRIDTQKRRDELSVKRNANATQAEAEMKARSSAGPNANRGSSDVFNQQEQSVFDEIKSWLGSGPR